MEAAGLFRTDGGLAIRCAATRIFGRRLLIVRPEKIGIELHQSPDAPNSHPGTVEFVSYLGAIMEYQVRLRSGEIVTVQTANRSAGDGDELLLGGGGPSPVAPRGVPGPRRGARSRRRPGLHRPGQAAVNSNPSSTRRLP